MEASGGIQMKRQTAVPVFLVAVLLAGFLAVRFWYDSKCVKFQDENMEIQTLYLLDSGRGRVRKEELEQIESFYVTKTSGRFTTLEDLKQFPNLERVSLSYDVNSMTGEESEEFQKQRGTIPAMLAETLPELPKLKQQSFYRHFAFAGPEKSGGVGSASGICGESGDSYGNRFAEAADI